MARRRMITSDIWNDEKLAALDRTGRLVFIGLITLANDYGKLRGNPSLIRHTLFPYDVDKINIDKYLSELSRHKIIMLYKVNGEQFILINKWQKHQTLTYRGKDNLPAVPIKEQLSVKGDTIKGHKSRSVQFSSVESSIEESSIVQNSSDKAASPAKHNTLSLAETEQLKSIQQLINTKRRK